MEETPLNDLNSERFAAVKDTMFQVSNGTGDSVPLKLIEVNQSRQRPGRATRGDSFSLLFAGPKTHFLQQHLYDFTHETIGRFPLFIVPVGQDAAAFHYEAVFSRIETARAAGATQERPNLF